MVTTASTPDTDGLKVLLSVYLAPRVQRLKKLWGDGGYRGEQLKKWVGDLKKNQKRDFEKVYFV